MKWFLLLPAWLLFNILAYIVAPILPLFAEKRLGPCDNNNAQRIEPRLPTWLSWFDTFDNSLYGDGGWREYHCPVGWDSYWGMTKWLWRNPAYGFERSVLSAKISPSDSVTCKGNPFIQDSPRGLEGVCCTKIGNYWNLYVVKKVTETKCLKLNFGWKLKTYAEYPLRVNSQPIAQYVFSPRLVGFVT